MNNAQFRKLMLDNSTKSGNTNDDLKAASHGNAASNGLGSRKHASIPMTPRSVAGSNADFAKQLAERNRASNPSKQFKSSAPRGIKLASGYTDRSREREHDAEDQRAARISALEKSFKDGEIDKDTFSQLTHQIAGGELESTHLVKGLDFKLLERIRRGEDVYGEAKNYNEAEDTPDTEEPTSPSNDIDDEFGALESQDIRGVQKDQREKKRGELSSVSLVPGKKRTRDQILADFKAARTKAQSDNALNSRFSKIGGKKTPGSRIEIDQRGREVLIIIDEDGHEKRKVRKAGTLTEAEQRARSGLLELDANAKPLGMEVPEHVQKQPEPDTEEDVDIFDGVGDDYDPLAGMDGSEDNSGSEDEGAVEEQGLKAEGPREDALSTTLTENAAATDNQPAPVKRNYFKDSKTGLVSEEKRSAPSMSDPAISAAIKRAAAMNMKPMPDNEESAQEAEARRAKEERHRKLLQSADRDEEDMDMGFGTSRFEDEEDFDDSKVKLSRWGDEDGDGEGAHGGRGKRKRGPKKRKGDGNNADDVLRVMAQRKKS